MGVYMLKKRIGKANASNNLFDFNFSYKVTKWGISNAFFIGVNLVEFRRKIFSAKNS